MTLARRIARIVAAAGVGFLAVLAVAAFIWRGDIVRAWLDPKQPFQTYRPPLAPNYATPEAWALLPAHPELWTAADPVADVFFLHPTTFNGGKDWLGPIADRASARWLSDTALPNYAGPYQRVARVFAPRYRQASLYAFMTNREDAQDARRFPYRDVEAAFHTFIAHYNGGRPFLIVGVEQGGDLAARLLDQIVAKDPALKARLVAAVFIDTVAPADQYGPSAAVPACASPKAFGCVLAWQQADGLEADRLRKRALVWTREGRLDNLGERTPLCVNPLLGRTGADVAPKRLDLGATNATGLEWGARPAFLPRAVSAECAAGFLNVSQPTSPSLRQSGGWLERFKTPPFNLFYLNEEVDAQARIAAFTAQPGWTAPIAPMGAVVQIIHAPVHRAL